MTPANTKRVLRELADLTKNPPSGITLLPYDDDIANLNFILDGPVDTPYEGGRFRISLRLGADFPAAPPKGERCVWR